MAEHRRAAAWCALVALALALAACGGVPTTGPIHLAKAPPGAVSDPDTLIRQLPSGPTAGMSPRALVAGFFDAIVDSDSNYHVAHEFLVRDTTWDTGSSSLVYDGEPRIRRDGADGVSVTLQRTGTIDALGEYRVDPGPASQHFDVLRINGNWRISKLPSGIALSDTDAQRSLQPAAIYFFNRPGTRLVPEPILVPPDLPSLATTLVHALLNGPSATLAPAVTTAAPAGVTLVDNVTIDGGVAEVDLSATAQQLSSAQLQRLSAQIVWTLRQVSTVTSVALVNDGKPVTAIGVKALQPINSWGQYAPQSSPASVGALASDNGRIRSIGMSVPASIRRANLSDPAISADALSVAVLRGQPGKATLLLGSVFGPLAAPFVAGSFTAPAFDPAGDVYDVRRVGSGSQMVELTGAHTIHTVVLPRSLQRQQISAISISADGTRMAMVVGPPTAAALYVGVIVTVHGRPEIRFPALVIPASQVVSGVAWEGGNEIVTTVQTSVSTRAVLATTVDGYSTMERTTVGLPTMPTQVAAAPGEPLIAAADGYIYSLSGGHWTRVTRGDDPAYPG